MLQSPSFTHVSFFVSRTPATTQCVFLPPGLCPFLCSQLFTCLILQYLLHFKLIVNSCWASPGGLVVNNSPALQELQEMWVRFLDWEDPLEEGMATHSSILVWRIPWTEKACRLQSSGSQRVGHD